MPFFAVVMATIKYEKYVEKYKVVCFRFSLQRFVRLFCDSDCWIVGFHGKLYKKSCGWLKNTAFCRAFVGVLDLRISYQLIDAGEILPLFVFDSCLSYAHSTMMQILRILKFSEYTRKTVNCKYKCSKYSN